MRTIKPNQDFKHGKKTYRKGRKYQATEEDAKYFESVGWVGEIVEGKEQSLKIDDVMLGHTSEVN